MRPGDIRFEDLSKHVESVASSLGTVDMTQALGEARFIIQQGIRAGFNSSVDVETGTGWAPRRHKYPHPPLMRSGAMMQAATGGGAGAIARVQPQQLDVGVSGSVIGYAAFHQDGTSRMAARPFVGASTETLDLIAEKIADAGLSAF